MNRNPMNDRIVYNIYLYYHFEKATNQLRIKGLSDTSSASKVKQPLLSESDGTNDWFVKVLKMLFLSDRSTVSTWP